MKTERWGYPLPGNDARLACLRWLRAATGRFRGFGMRRWTARLVAASLTMAVVGVGVPISTAQATSGTAVVYATLGCGNQVRVQWIDSTGRTVRDSLAIKGRAGLQLIPYDYQSSKKRLLLAAYDCRTRTDRLLVATLGSRKAPRTILTLPTSRSLYGAAYDLATGQPQALIVDRSGTSGVAAYSGGRWTAVWSNQDSRFYPEGLVGGTGREFLVYGRDFSTGRWQVRRVARFGGDQVVLSGPGSSLRHVSRSTLEQVTAFVTPTQTYVCSFPGGYPYYDTVEDGVSEGSCSTVRWQAREGFFLPGSRSNTHLLTLVPTGGTQRAWPVTCSSTGFTCGRPSIGTPRQASTQGQDHVTVSWLSLGRLPVQQVR